MTAVLTEQITVAGTYDIPADVYHADPVAGGSLSSTGARRLLPPSCPALFRWERDHPSGPRKAFDVGHAAHKLVLGAGPKLVRIDAEEWRTNAVKADVAAARAEGAVPLRPSEYDMVHTMAAALLTEPLARALLSPDRGAPERTLVWRDDATGVMCRAMVDYLPHPSGRRPVLVDYKTTTCAYPRVFVKAAGDYGYHQQAAFYLDGAAVLLGDDPAFLFVAQEKTAPYLVSVVELDDDAIDYGRARNRRALEIYRDCTASGIWPGYTPDIARVALPPWVLRQEETDSEL